MCVCAAVQAALVWHENDVLYLIDLHSVSINRAGQSLGQLQADAVAACVANALGASVGQAQV